MLHLISLRHITLGRTPLYEGSARRRDIYVTTHNTHKRQTSMLLAEFEPTIPASKRPQTHVSKTMQFRRPTPPGHSVTGIGERCLYSPFMPSWNGQDELLTLHSHFTNDCLIILLGVYKMCHEKISFIVNNLLATPAVCGLSNGT